MKLDLLRRLDAIVSEANNVIEEWPNGIAAELLFEPLQDLGWAVDQLLTQHKERRSRQNAQRKARREARHAR